MKKIIIILLSSTILLSCKNKQIDVFHGLTIPIIVKEKKIDTVGGVFRYELIAEGSNKRTTKIKYEFIFNAYQVGDTIKNNNNE